MHRNFVPWILVLQWFFIPNTYGIPCDPIILAALARTPGTNVHKAHELQFKRIGDSNLFERGSLVLQMDEKGDFTPMLTFDEYLNLDSLVGIRKGDRFGGRALIFVENSPGEGTKVMERSVNGSGGGYFGDKIITADQFSGISFADQLLSIGFKRDPHHSNIFRGDLEGNEIVAVVEAGRITHLLKPVDPRVAEKIKAGTKIRKYGEQRGRFSTKMNSELTVQSDDLEFAFSSEYGGSIVEGSQRSLKDVKVLNPADIKSYKSYEPFEDPHTGFVYGGTNTTKTLEHLAGINGIPVARLEESMRPGKSSGVGFLGQRESLLKVMMDDNDTVTQELGLTHQALAEPLKVIRALYDEQHGREFTYHGTPYELEVTQYKGSQISPFGDNTGASADFKITNLKNGKSLSGSFLLADMIERYGFYEGHETPYRMDPKQIVEVFDFLKAQAKPKARPPARAEGPAPSSPVAWPSYRPDFVQHYDHAVQALIDGRTYDAPRADEEAGNGQEVMSAFIEASKNWDSFVPKLMNDVSQKSNGRASLTPIDRNKSPLRIMGMAKYFVLTRQTDNGEKRNLVVLAQNGIAVFTEEGRTLPRN